MRDRKQLINALPYLSLEQLLLVEKDVHRAADVAAMGGTAAQWQQYVDLEAAIKKEMERRFPKSDGSDCATPPTYEQELMLVGIYDMIRNNKCLKMLPCPFCGATPAIVVCDDEGNIHEDEYEEDPYSGLMFAIQHTEYPCPVTSTEPYAVLYVSRLNAIAAWNLRKTCQVKARR